MILVVIEFTNNIHIPLVPTVGSLVTNKITMLNVILRLNTYLMKKIFSCINYLLVCTNILDIFIFKINLKTILYNSIPK